MMRKILRIAFILLSTVSFVWGCATTNRSALQTEYSNYVEEMRTREDVVKAVKRANELFKKGEYRMAQRIYEGLLNRYRSTDGSFEVSVLTNICMTHLETGERGKFRDCAEKLKNMSRNLNYLSRETQMVLILNDIFADDGSLQNDKRIESRLWDGLYETFKEVK